MKNRGSFSFLRWISLSLILFAVVLMIFQLIRFSRLWATYPSGLTIAGVAVGNLNRQQAADRLLEIYTLPVEVHYGKNIIQIEPSVIGFNLDLDSMLAAADQERTRVPFWEGFWNYLWGRTTSPANIPLVVNYSTERLRTYLSQEISSRYDQPPIPALPVAGSVNFQPGIQGTALDIDRAILLIDSALRSNRLRTVMLPLQTTSPSRPTIQNLEVLLKQTVLDIYQFDGVIGLYQLDLQTGQEISFIYNNREPVTSPPDVSFTASSTIKIPIMISAFRRLGGNTQTEKPLDEETIKNLEAMIGQSNNQASDWIMATVMDQFTGPLIVSQDMQELGFENTFLAGYFATGAPLLKVFKTPGNQRTDISTDPDIYSQTTAAEVGQLLVDIYQCAQNGQGTLRAVFAEEITQEECQMMLQNLKKDRTPALIPAGVPDGIEVAHKHGWVSDAFGIIHNMSDAAIVFTKGGDYVLSIFLYHPNQLIYEPANKLVSDLSRAVYNYYNLPAQ
jgi:beta-lactamase class A